MILFRFFRFASLRLRQPVSSSSAETIMILSLERPAEEKPKWILFCDFRNSLTISKLTYKWIISKLFPLSFRFPTSAFRSAQSLVCEATISPVYFPVRFSSQTHSNCLCFCISEEKKSENEDDNAAVPALVIDGARERIQLASVSRAELVVTVSVPVPR